jgi:uncharacterized membrane protein
MTTATQDLKTTGRRHADQVDDPYTEEFGGGNGSYSPTRRDPVRTARGLGWFSIGLGLAEIAAPRRVARLIGIDDDDSNRNLLFAFGIREIASGIGILTQDQPRIPVWSRVGGDLMDLAFLGRALASDDADRSRVGLATAAVLGVTALDVLTGQQLSKQAQGGSGRVKAIHGINIRRDITVGLPPEEVYRFWRDFTNLPRFMEHLESVRVDSETRSHWTARAPAGATVEWDAEIITDRPGELISWRSVDDADVPNTGSVRFAAAPGGRGTEIRVELRYDPPGGKLGTLVAKLFGEEPGQQVDGDLRRLKQVLETGDVMRSDASIHRGMHPARPSAKPEITGAGR